MSKHMKKQMCIFIKYVALWFNPICGYADALLHILTTTTFNLYKCNRPTYQLSDSVLARRQFKAYLKTNSKRYKNLRIKIILFSPGKLSSVPLLGDRFWDAFAVWIYSTLHVRFAAQPLVACFCPSIKPASNDLGVYVNKFGKTSLVWRYTLQSIRPSGIALNY